MGKDEVIDSGWLGPDPSNTALSRLGDVAVVARGNVSFGDPSDATPSWLVARHGSVSSAEMYVPLLSFAS